MKSSNRLSLSGYFICWLMDLKLPTWQSKCDCRVV